MADNVAVTPGAGATIATDEVTIASTLVQVQRVKLLASADGSAADLSRAEDTAHTSGDHGLLNLGVRVSDANASTSLAVADGNYAAQQLDQRGALLVHNRARSERIAVNSAGLTIATTAYTAGDQVGTIFTLPNCSLATGGTGTIQSITVVDKADVIGDVVLWLFRSTVTLAADNAAFSISDADMDALIGYVWMPTARDLPLNRASTLGGVGLGYDCAATSLFCAVETRSANSFFAAVTDLRLIVHVNKD